MRELYRMGYLTPEQSVRELDALAAAAYTTGQEDPEAARVLVARIESFKEEIQEYMGPSKTASPMNLGRIRFPFLNVRRAP